jgi:histidine ammonia-lyase
MRLTDSAGLDARAVLAVARGGLVPELGDDLIGWLDRRRARMLAALDVGGPVYGVTTGCSFLLPLLRECRAAAAGATGSSRYLPTADA